MWLFFAFGITKVAIWDDMEMAVGGNEGKQLFFGGERMGLKCCYAEKKKYLCRGQTMIWT